jgi:hypothetical protein
MINLARKHTIAGSSTPQSFCITAVVRPILQPAMAATNSTPYRPRAPKGNPASSIGSRDWRARPPAAPSTWRALPRLREQIGMSSRVG